MAPAEVRSQGGGDGQLVERLRAGGVSRLRRVWSVLGRRKGLKPFARNQRILLEGSTRGSSPGQAYLRATWLTTES